ncbi:MAG: SpoVA/SpoVAEb family sporulation membrane protein [Bacilli bacterium]|nr:SpoVA/SpoVAEb family sporulation membrane protein [Bacilli bacterium]
MIYLYSFLFAGIVCLIGQIILDNTKLLPGHITSLFVVIGAALDVFSIYDFFVNTFGAGAVVCITSFGHLLIHGALSKAASSGLLGLFTGMFSLTATGITATIIFAFIFTMIFKARD